MKSQKLIIKCLFLLALFFLAVIFFYAVQSNGMEDAGNDLQQHTQASKTQASMGPSTSPETDARLTPRGDIERSTASESLEHTVNPSLKLMAVFQAHSPLASAVIHSEGHGAHRYRVGEVLPEGGVLAAIRPTEVIVYADGRQITLRMALMGGSRPTDVVDAAPAQNDDRPTMPWQVVDFLKKMDLTPVSEDSPKGYRVGEGFPKSGTEEVGVKPGDTIVAVNGYPVGEYHSDYLVWLSFKDRNRASVLVRSEEGGQFTFHFPDDLESVSLSGPGG